MLFNPLKHHLLFQIHSILDEQSRTIDNFLRIKKFIGTGPMDLYTGEMPVPEIMNHCKMIANTENLFNAKAYKNWLRAESADKDYRLLEFPDGSTWVFRLGKHPKRFMHIHPGRNSEKSIRIKPNTLKTIIAIIFEHGFMTEMPTIEQISNVREKYLELEPLDENENIQAIVNLLQIFATTAVIYQAQLAAQKSY